jgi:uncharacterized membrane protein
MFGWTMGLDGWLWMGAWVVVLVVLVWFLVREPRRSSSPDEPVEILRARLARGEISAEEFQRAIALLKPYPTTEEGFR